MIAAGNDGLFRRLAKALGRAEWADMEAFATNGARVVHREALIAMIADIVRENSTAYWEKRLTAAQVPNAPLQNAQKVMAHAQTKALDIIQWGPNADCPMVGLPLSFNGSRPAFRQNAPGLGEDTRAVLGPYINQDAHRWR